MWPSIRRWRGWPMDESGGLARMRPGPEALHVGWELAGLTLAGPAVPWCAEAVTLEAGLRLPPLARRLEDFTLKLPGRDPIRPEAIRADEAAERHRVFFRFAPPAANGVAELSWRDRPLGRVEVTLISRAAFLDGLKLHHPSVHVRLADRAVACQAFVTGQAVGWWSAGLLTAAMPLAPLSEIGVRAEVCDAAGAVLHESPIGLTAGQLAGRQTLLAYDPRLRLKGSGPWTVNWRAGEKLLGTTAVRGVTASSARRGLRAVGARFVVSAGGAVVVRRYAPGPDERLAVGPCFLVAVTEPGLAARMQFEVAAMGAGRPPWVVDAVVTDGPTPVAPGLLAPEETAGLTGFELRLRGKVVAKLPLHPAPAVKLTAEGGFVPPGEFAWTAAADEELAARLGRLAGL